VSVKEQLIELIRAEGYDFFTAAELAHNCLEEFKASDKTEEIYHVKGQYGKWRSFGIRKTKERR
jgi:hypothetical protein